MPLSEPHLTPLTRLPRCTQAFGSAAGGADISSVLDDSAEQVSAPTAAIEAVDMADFQIDASLLAEEDLLPEGEQSSGDSIADIVAGEPSRCPAVCCWPSLLAR